VPKKRKNKPGDEGAGEADAGAPKPKKRRPSKPAALAGAGDEEPAETDLAMYHGADAAVIAAATAALMPLCDVPAAPPALAKVEAPPAQPVNIFAAFGIE